MKKIKILEDELNNTDDEFLTEETADRMLKKLRK